MTWKEALDLGPTELSRLLGCSPTTASNWIHRSGPAEWLKPILVAHVERQIDAEQAGGNDTVQPVRSSRSKPRVTP